ncbi:hypothetical protein A4X13_0g5035 [Tilletia indica]|uniref:TTI1 C-terminal TPR domain-containing protein n=1 Tax=Tilletia indica TaxID=43049 RepID=A0A177TUL9_9BASI|nr:hypothetical protein A4X13_0g5035 [Tilletia indica]
MFGRASGPGRLEVDRLCAQVIETAQRPKDAACGEKVEELIKVLERRRQDNLAVLGSGLDMTDIEKVYTALSWLLRDNGGVGVSDPTRAAVFRALTLLAEDWYPAWATDEMVNYKRWKTLVGLGVFLLLRSAWKPPAASASTSAPKGTDEKAKVPPNFSIKLGESTRIAILEFLNSMLKARTKKSRHSDTSSKAKDPWEWDGVSELPSLQDALDFFEYDPDLKADTGASSSQETIHTIFPTRKHKQWAAQSTETSRLLMQICVLSLESSADPDLSELLRATALKTAQTTFTTWLVGVDQARLEQLRSKGIEARDKTFDKPSLELAIKAQAILPGMVSALIKTLTGRATGSDSSKSKLQALPSKAGLAPLALQILAETTLLGFNDRATARVRSSTISKTQADGPISTLADLTELAARMSTSESDSENTESSKDPEGAVPSSEGQGMPPQTQMFLTSTKRVSGALKQVLSTFSNLHTIHHATLTSALDMAAALWLQCGETFSWAEAHSENQSTAQSSTSEDLVRLIIDITAVSSGTSKTVEAHGWDVLLALVGVDTSRPNREIGVDEPGLKALSSIDRISSTALEQLSTAIHSDDEEQVVILARRVKIAASLFQRVAEATPNTIAAGLVKPGISQGTSLSLLTLILDSGSTLGNQWTSHPTFVRWSSSLLSELQLAEDADVADVVDGGAPLTLRLRKLGADADTAVRSALSAISAALTSAWTIRARESSEKNTSSTKTRLSASKSVEESFAFVFHFLREGSRFRTARLTADATFARQMCSSALFVADVLLQGLVEQITVDRSRTAAAMKPRRKVAKKLGKIVTQLVKSMLEEDMEEAMDPENVLALITERQQKGKSLEVASSDPSSSSAIEFQKGFKNETSSSASALAAESGGFLEAGLVGAVSLDKKANGATTTALITQEKALRQVDIANALLLNLLATAAELLGRDFEPNLIGLIYPLVCASTANAGIVRSAGQSALARIAAACGYGSSTQALRACADWIVSATSQRIVTDLGLELELLTQMHTSVAEESLLHQSGGTGAGQLIPMAGTLGGCALPLGSAQAAPFVLVEFVRLLGTEALASVEDAVDEVLDALDRYHGYEDICEGLLGVLRALLAASVDSLAASRSAQPLQDVNKVDDGISAHAKQEWLPKIQVEIAAFEQWFKVRREPERLDFDFEDEEKKTSQATEEAASKDEESGTKPKQSGEDTLNPPPSRSQQVVADILEKSIAFLGHSSAHIRAQVLRLLGYGVSVLAPQHRDLELIPVLNRAWPLVLARLGSSATTPGPQQAGHRLNQSRIRSGKRQTMMGKRSESEPFVWLEAVKLVAVLAEHSPDHFGQKIVDDVWPRLRLLLSEVAQVPAARQTQRVASGQKATSGTSSQVPLLFVPDEHSVGCRLLAEVLIVLRLTIRGVSIHLDETQAWAMACDPVVLGSLHPRQPLPIRQAAEGLFVELATRNADAVWLLLREFVEGRSEEGQNEAMSSKHLCALRPELDLEPELWQRILCELKSNRS